jgi:hypothetical protein
MIQGKFWQGTSYSDDADKKDVCFTFFVVSQKSSQQCKSISLLPLLYAQGISAYTYVKASANLNSINIFASPLSSSEDQHHEYQQNNLLFITLHTIHPNNFL